MKSGYSKCFFTRKEYGDICSIFKIGALEGIFCYAAQGYESSKVFVKTDKGKFVISSYKIRDTPRPKPYNLIMQEIRLIRLLDDLPVPRYISSGNKYVVCYKKTNVTVYRYIEGCMPKRLNDSRVYQLGKFLGKFHRLGKKFKDRLDGRRKFYDLNDSVMDKMDVYSRKQTNLLLKRNFERIREGVKNNRLPNGLGLARGPIHVDLKPMNELFIKDRLSGILDFGIFYRDHPLSDIGKTIMWNCSRNGKIDKNLLKNFLKGYEEERILPKKEKELLKQATLFAIYAHIYVDYYHVPLHIVPESYTVGLVKEFLPIADDLENRMSI
ncbi:MAG: phosphotransferase [Candidatus Woesearchaeota archaeon]|nr:phosphotransferase [Candidatus Woesearchaeota archaeon]